MSPDPTTLLVCCAVALSVASAAADVRAAVRAARARREAARRLAARPPLPDDFRTRYDCERAVVRLLLDLGLSVERP